MWSDAQQSVYFTELAVPQEDAANEAWGGSGEEGAERRKLHYSELAVEAEQQSWKARIQTAKAGCHELVATVYPLTVNSNDYHVLLLLQATPHDYSLAASCTLSEIHSQSPLVVTLSTL